MQIHKSKKKQDKKNKKAKDIINIALAGNANVGKSVIFNQLTGLSQTIGNWPGKTVEKMEGHLNPCGPSSQHLTIKKRRSSNENWKMGCRLPHPLRKNRYTRAGREKRAWPFRGSDSH